MMKDEGYVFSRQYIPKTYKPDYIEGYRYHKYFFMSLLFSAGFWLLAYTLGGSI